MNDNADNDPRLYAIPDIHGHAKGEHKAFGDERPIPLSARMLFLWFYHACRRGWPRFLMVTDHMNYLTFEDPAAISLVRRALKLAQAGDLYGAAETASVEVGHAAVVSEGLRRGMRYSIGAEVDNDPRSRPDAQNIVEAMKPDGMIRSVHFLTIDHPTHGPNWSWPFDNPEFADVFDIVGTAKTWELYMATLLDAVERLPGNILGHFYVPAIAGHWPDDATLEAYEDQIVAACEARGIAIEFNTRFLYRDHPEDERAKFLAANRRLLTKCKAKNVGIAVGSDAHSPKDQGRAFASVLALLDECEINELIFPIAGRLARVALRIERKVDAVPEPVAPAAEERKPRKARPSESPARADDLPTLADAPAAGDTAPAATASKARAKRSRAKTKDVAAIADSGDDRATPPPISHAETAIDARVPESEPAASRSAEWDAAATPVAASPAAGDAAEASPDVASAKPEASSRAVGADDRTAEPDTVTESVTAPDDSRATATAADADAAETREPAVPHTAIAPDAPPVSSDTAQAATGVEAVAAVPGVAEAVPATPDGRPPAASFAAEAAASAFADTEAPAAAVHASDADPLVEHTADAGSAVARKRKSTGTQRPRSTGAAPPADTAKPAGSGDGFGAAPGPAGDSRAALRSPDAEPREDTSGIPVVERNGVVHTSRPKRTPVAMKAAEVTIKPKPVPVKAKSAAKKAARPAATSTAQRTAMKKSTAKKTAMKKAVVKKAPPKKAPAKKAAPKKAAARVPATRPSVAKKATAKKTAAKKPAQKRR